MTRQRFRAAVILYFALATLAMTTACVGESGLPAPLAQYLAERRRAEPSPRDWGLLPLFGLTVEPGVTTALNYAAGMLYGALLAWAYSPPAAAWFETAPPETRATR